MSRSDQPGRTGERTTEIKDTVERLRRDLDAGRGRDKVDYPDPAAAPLGTDDEAAGTPITEEQLRMARADENRERYVSDPDAARTAGGEGAVSMQGADRTAPRTRGENVKAAAQNSSIARFVMIALLLIVVAAILIFVFPPL